MIKDLFSAAPNVCGWTGVEFDAVEAGCTVRHNAFCLACGSAERHREFIKCLDEKERIGQGKTMLEIGPIMGF